MSRERALGLLAAVIVAAVGLAGCGGGGSGTTTTTTTTKVAAADPASMISASVIAYVDVAIKPQGSVKADLVNSIDKVAGPGAADKLANQILKDSSFRKFVLLSGDHIGIALTGIPHGSLSGNALEADLLAVVPMASPAAAKKFIAQNPSTTPGEIDRAVGRFAIGAGSAAIKSLVRNPNNSLAADPSYQSAIAQLDGDQLATVFVRAKPLYDALVTALSANPTESQTLAKEAGKLGPDSSMALGLGVGQNTFRLDLVTHAIPSTTNSAVTGDVGSQPGDSWLALAVNLNAQVIKALTAGMQSLLAAQAATGAAGGNTEAIVNDVVSALGPITLSAAGTSIGGLQAGLTLTPLNVAAGANLLSVLKQNLKKLPLVVSRVGKQIVISYGYADPKDLTSPSTHLSDNPTYKAALAQLPSGSHVPIYVNLGDLSGFAKLDNNPKDASVWRAVGELNYLIEGGTSTHTRIVVAVK